MDFETEYDEETIDYFYEQCDIEKIFTQLSRILKEINKIVPGRPENTRNIGNNIMTIFNDIDKNCLVRLSSFLLIQIPAAANQMSRHDVIGTARRCIPHINSVLNFLKDEFFMTDEEEGEEDNETEDGDDVLPVNRQQQLQTQQQAINMTDEEGEEDNETEDGNDVLPVNRQQQLQTQQQAINTEIKYASENPIQESPYDECVICSDLLNNIDGPGISGNCQSNCNDVIIVCENNHRFHRSCILNWCGAPSVDVLGQMNQSQYGVNMRSQQGSNKCPVCRQRINCSELITKPKVLDEELKVNKGGKKRINNKKRTEKKRTNKKRTKKRINKKRTNKKRTNKHRQTHKRRRHI